MKPLVQNIVITLLLLLFFGHCREPFQFDTQSQAGLLVVDGNINDQPAPYFLNLGTTNTPGLKAQPYTNAVVTISDELGNTETYHEIEKGRYQLDGKKVTGRPGGTYTLHITLTDGRKFDSFPEKLPSGTKAIDASSIKVLNEKTTTDDGEEVSRWNVKLFLTTNLGENNKSGRYRWAVSEVWNLFPTCFLGQISCPQICYIYDPLSKFDLRVVKASDYADTKISNLQIMSRTVDFSFNGRHFFNITQYSMNEGAFDYWNQVSLLLNKRGSIFDTPPAEIRGNVRNVNEPNEWVLGYFEASGTVITRNFIDRGAIPTHVQTCYIFDPEFDPTSLSEFCFDCRRHPGATTVEPPWFE